MSECAKYVQSDPRRRKTMVLVLDLPSCVARGPTTDLPLAATSEAIHRHLRFLERYAEAVCPEDAFTTVVAEHVAGGPWSGNSNPVE